MSLLVLFGALVFAQACGIQLREDEFFLAPVANCRPCDPCFENNYFAEDTSIGPGPIGVEQKHTVAGFINYADASGCSGSDLFQFHGLASGNGLVDIPWNAAIYSAPSTSAQLMQLIVDALNTTETACYSLVTSGLNPKIHAEFRSGASFDVNVFERFLGCGEVAGTDGWSFGVSADTTSTYNCSMAGSDVNSPYDSGTCAPPPTPLDHGTL